MIDSEMKPFSKEWGKKSHAVNSFTMDSLAKQLSQSKTEKLSSNWFYYMKLGPCYKCLQCVQQVKTKQSQWKKILPHPERNVYPLLLTSWRCKTVQHKWCLLTVVSLKVVFSMWCLLNSDIYWGLVFQKQESRSLFKFDWQNHLKLPIIGHNSELKERWMRWTCRSGPSLGLDCVIRRHTEAVVDGEVWYVKFLSGFKQNAGIYQWVFSLGLQQSVCGS